jgi:hypothetical protein
MMNCWMWEAMLADVLQGVEVEDKKRMLVNVAVAAGKVAAHC